MLKQNSRKITFVGAHGTGKTTLVTNLQENLNSKGVSTVITPEVPRVICETEKDNHFFRRENNTLVKQISLLFGQTVYEKSAEMEQSSVVLCDRSILDHWGYTKVLFPKQLDESGVYNSLLNFIAKHCQSYDQIFYVPIEFSPVDDGTREDDVKFQQEIDKEIFKGLETVNLPYKTVKGTISERVEIVLEVLGYNS